MRYVGSESAEPARVAYTVGRNAGNAVVRNRLRRRLRAAVAEISEELELGGAYLLGAGTAVIAMPYSTVCEHVRALVRLAATAPDPTRTGSDR